MPRRKKEAPPAKPEKAAAEKPASRLAETLGGQLASEMEGKAFVSVGDHAGTSVRLPGVLPTRAPTLDWAIGRGGWPMGRLSILSGKEAAGKTTLCLCAIAEAQARGGVGLLVDSEHKVDLDYAATLGVNINDLILVQPKGLEVGIETFGRLVRVARSSAPEVPIVAILDSMNASRTADEFESDYEDQHVSPQARVMSQLLPRLIVDIARTHAALIFVSQIRAVINQGPKKRELVACGNAPKHYASVIVELYSDGFLKESERNVGSKVIAKVIKNQIAPPFRQGAFDLRWGQGVDYEQGLLDRGVQLGLMNRGGSGRYEMPWEEETLRFQGRKGFVKLVEKHPQGAKIRAFLEHEHFAQSPGVMR